MSTEPTSSGHFDLRVLLAEDSLLYQKLATGILTTQGHQVTVVENGQDAVRAISDRDFDVVLMDVEMPVMNGLAATSAIRDLEEDTGHHVPIIAVTTTPDRDVCIKAGMDAFLPKPLNAEALDAVLHRVCNSAA